MKFVAPFAVFFLCLTQVHGQQAPPAVQWQQSLGGTADDILYSAQRTSDGGFVLGGSSASETNSFKSAPRYGGNDFWVVRLDASGHKLWDASFGGSGNDVLYSLIQTADGGFLLAGYSNSGTSGNKTSPNLGAGDFWIVRLDATGKKLWDKSFGGTGEDGAYAVLQAGDGGFFCAGYSYSAASGNKTSGNLGGSDFWVVRLDSSGNKLWDASFGGTDEDTCYSMVQTLDGGVVLAGSSSSSVSGNKTAANFGGTDFWVVRLDAGGNKLWDHSFGGTSDDGYTSVSLASTPDGGFVVGGDSFSGANGNKSSAGLGLDDFWVVRLDANGNALWDRTFGGAGSDFLTSLLVLPQGGFLLAGGSSSGVSGNKSSPPLGRVDYWVVRLDDSGNKLWDAAFGGSGNDGFYNVVATSTSNGEFLIAGDSDSPISGNKTEPALGGTDFWVVKLGTARPTLTALMPQNPATSGFQFYLQGQAGMSYASEYSADLTTWTSFSTNQVTGGQVLITDTGSTNATRRYYRARQLP